MRVPFYEDLLRKKRNGEKAFVLLIDPDEYPSDQLIRTLHLANEAKVDYLFIGGSLLIRDRLSECLQLVREKTSLPSVLFPGSPLQFHEDADSLLLLSLISGRNPDMLIGRHVEIAPAIKRSNVEPVPTGYMLIDGGKPTSVSYISNTQPIPSDKADIAASTAMAGELLGLRCIYMDAGSGAQNPVPARMINKVSDSISIPLLVGGGLNSEDKIATAGHAGADAIVVGNALEKGADKLPEFVQSFKNSESPVKNKKLQGS